MEKLLKFVDALRNARASFTVDIARSEAVMVTVVVPGERVEVEFFADGRIEIERFVSAAAIADATEDDLVGLIDNS